MIRRVSPEWLDQLSPDDPRALKSRRDLVRLNGWMRNARFLASTLSRDRLAGERFVLADLGAGDGSTALAVISRLSKNCRLMAADVRRRNPRNPPPYVGGYNSWSEDVSKSRIRPLPGREKEGVILLIDRLPSLDPGILAKLQSLGWNPNPIVGDIFETLQDSNGVVGDAAMANLFLHHFEDARLRVLLGLVASRFHQFVACEPRRSSVARLGARCVGLIGCNAVSRHDARVSVDAGFCGTELSALWPDAAGWQFEERAVGWFSHLFVARRAG